MCFRVLITYLNQMLVLMSVDDTVSDRVISLLIVSMNLQHTMSKLRYGRKESSSATFNETKSVLIASLSSHGGYRSNFAQSRMDHITRVPTAIRRPLCP